MSSAPERLGAALADRYRIERELGQGGMAMVYLAQDLRHDRKVAIKVLRPELAAIIGAERFLSEIKTTANLQHPHILPLFDSGEADTFLFYVMPFIEGETVRDRLNREKQLPIADAVRIATEVAGALDYAHRHGIIHRDIKPENVLLHDGRALVADFGIALAATSAGSRMTETGMSLGTPHYMSPEQAMGDRELTPRSDVYALGAMTYEMLLGEPPFTGPTAQSIVAKVMSERPAPLTARRDRISPQLEDAVLTALEKLPADRFASAAELGAALADRNGTMSASRFPAAPGRRRPRTVSAIAGWVAAAVAIAAAVWGWNRTAEEATSRFLIGFPRGQTLDIASDGTHLALSPDGSVMAYVGGDSSDTRLYVKQRNELTAIPLPGTEGAFNPFFSPDGRDLGYFSERGGRALYRIALAGGLPQVVYRGVLGTSGATWGTDGYIYVDTDWEGLQRIRPDGGGRETVMALDSLRDEIGFAWPDVLPGDRIVIVRVRRANDGPENFDIVAGRIGTKERVTVTRAVSARYVRGHLLFVTADGTLQAARFDEGRLALAGAPVVVSTEVRVAGSYAGVDLAADRNGAVLYVGGPAGLTSQLEWVDSRGLAVPVDSAWHPSGYIWDFALSPDGGHIAVSLAGGGNFGTNIWVKQLPTGPFMKLAGPRAFDPRWSPDGKWLYYSSRRTQPHTVHRVRADGLGEDSVVMRATRSLESAVASWDGRWLVASAGDTATPPDIYALELGRDTAARELIATRSAEWGPALSPDGRWLAYVSQSSGRSEVYVRPFPAVDRGLWQVSLNGGYGPKWANSGNALFFRELGAGTIMVADVETSPDFSRSSPRVAFRPAAGSGIMMGEGYDVSVDGSRFLVVSRGAANITAHLVRIENVLAQLGNERTP